MNAQQVQSALMASKKHRHLAWRQEHRAFQAAVVRQWCALAPRRPAQIAVGTLTGSTYGALIATVLGTLGAMSQALLSGCDLFEVGENLPWIAFVLVPQLAWALARVPAGIGGIVGAACIAIPSRWAGLEWGLVAGLGAAAGVGARYGRLGPALWGMAGGGLLGGAIGLWNWLTQSQRYPAPAPRRIWIVYGATAVSIAVYTWVMVNWVLIA